MRSSAGRDTRASKQNGTDHRQATRLPFREGDAREVVGAVDQDELDDEPGLTDELWEDFGQRSPVSGYPPGPKGYRRSDERIREDICDELMQMRDLDSSDVEVAVASGEVVLTGTVPDRSMKYRIEQVADRCAGVVEITNQVRVKRRS